MSVQSPTKRRILWSISMLVAAAGALISIVVGTISGCAAQQHYSAEHMRAEQHAAGTANAAQGSIRPDTLQPLSRGVPSTPPAHASLQPTQRNPMAHLVHPSALPAAGEELWVIERRSPTPAPAVMPADDPMPQSGALMAKLAPDTPPQQMQPCPLKHTSIKAEVAGYVAAVDVQQQFHNPFSTKIEAVYVFPLPSNAAVNEFVMTVGDRKIRGVIREKEQARQIYANARQQGFVASLLTQERPNVFTQSVANIEPGKQIDIDIRYFHTLSYADGWYELAIPTVVGPRFNPPTRTAGGGEGFADGSRAPGDGIGAVGPGGRGTSGQKSEVSYLPPGTRTGHDIAIEVDLDAGVAYEELRSVNHTIIPERRDERRAKVRLDPADSLPNKDFVLRWRVAGDQVKTGLFVAAGDKAAGADAAAPGESAGHFLMMVVPPLATDAIPAQPVEYVFTLDVSGSMSGRPIEQARAAMLHALRRLGPEDRFQVVKFAGEAEQMAPQPVAATPRNVKRAMDYVQRASAGGGTMMLEGMRRSLDFPRDPSRGRVVCFLTDGFIGNEAEILGSMRQWLGDARVFSFGVGSSTNRYLMDQMAKVGRGAAAYVSLNEDPEDAMGLFFHRVRHPAMTDISVDFGGMSVREVYPRRPGDLLVGRPVLLVGKYDGPTPPAVRVTGRVNGSTQTVNAPVQVAKDLTARALPPVWARHKIADLADAAIWTPSVDLPRQIKQVALEYGLMSNLTSFVAVDATAPTAGDHGVSTPVPVPVPDGVRYETTVPEAPLPPQAAQGQ